MAYEVTIKGAQITWIWVMHCLRGGKLERRWSQCLGIGVHKHNIVVDYILHSGEYLEFRLGLAGGGLQ